MRRVAELAAMEEKLVLGLLSGTSADGIDAALVRIRGCGLDTRVETVAFATVAYPDRLRDAILRLSAGLGGAAELCRLNFEIGERFAEAGLALLAQCGRKAVLAGSHGQTICHLPRRMGVYGSTLQIGEADVIAERLGIPVVSDFRTRDIAAGGEGAPLSAYMDYLLFRREGRTRALLNLGGIANVSVVTPAIEEVFAFDTGPANMPLDECVRLLTDGASHFDRDGRMAAQGRIDENLLRRLLDHPYLALPAPKTTGRETFGRHFVEPYLRGKGALKGVDILATLTAFVAHSIHRAFRDHVAPRAEATEIVASGGGVHNHVLMSHLRRLFGRVPVVTLSEEGIDPDAKEALLFAILANETIHGIPNNMPGATGARWPAVLGKVSP